MPQSKAVTTYTITVYWLHSRKACFPSTSQQVMKKNQDHTCMRVVRIIKYTIIQTLVVAWFNISCQARSMGEGEEGSCSSLFTFDSCDSDIRIISFAAMCWLLALSNRAAALFDCSWIWTQQENCTHTLYTVHHDHNNRRNVYIIPVIISLEWNI